jgi:hypothetical protein
MRWHVRYVFVDMTMVTAPLIDELHRAQYLTLVHRDPPQRPGRDRLIVFQVA